MNEFKCDRIVVPTDMSAAADRAVRYAHGMAERFGAELHVVHVIPDATYLTRSISGVLDAGGAGEDQGKQWLADVLGEPGGARRVEAVRIGEDVPATIAEYAQKHAADLIVIASHGRTGLKHLLFGSVTDKLMRIAHCPIVVVRATA